MNESIDHRLRSAGMSATEAGAKAELLTRCAAALGSANVETRLFVPGRIEFLGKHTDYAGGRSLVCAVEKGICGVVSARRDTTVRVIDVRKDSSQDVCEF